MKKQSAGILMYRLQGSKPEFLLAHPGGPFWINKDCGSWSIPKGEFEPQEDPLKAAIREFREETGYELMGEFKPLQPITQKSGKVVKAWAVRGDLDESAITSNLFDVEWPPRSGKKQSFPEIDRVGWFTYDIATEKIIPAQLPLLTELNELLDRKNIAYK